MTQNTYKNENQNSEEQVQRPQRKPRLTINSEMPTKIRRHIDRNQNPKIIAAEEEISLATVYNLMDKISSGATDQQIIEQKKGRIKSDSTIVKNIISRMLMRDNSFVQSEISFELGTKNIIKSQSTVSRLLKDMSYTIKRLVKIPMERNSVGTINNRQECARTIEFLSDNNLIFLDEIRCNLHQTRNYGYSPANTKAYKVVRGNRGKNISSMVAINNNGVVAFEIKDGSFDGDPFIQFINEKLVEHFERNPNDLLIMDNCRFHHKSDVNDFLRNKNINYLFLHPYSPQLNTIEEYFSYFKALLGAFENTSSSRIELKERISNIFQNSTISFNG